MDRKPVILSISQMIMGATIKPEIRPVVACQSNKSVKCMCWIFTEIHSWADMGKKVNKQQGKNYL